MKNLPLLMAVASLTFMSAASAQVQTYTTSFDITQNGGAEVYLDKFTGSLMNLDSVELLLDITSIDFTEDVAGTGGTPTAKLQDAVSVENGVPAAVDFDTLFTAPGTLGQNVNTTYTFDSATGTVFTNLPDYDIGSFTSDFANYQGSGTWADSVSSAISTLTSANGNFPYTSGISVKGTLEVFYNEPAEAPEPCSWALSLVSLGGLFVLRRFWVRA